MIRVRRALFSAYHKEGLLPLAREAAQHGAQLVSSGGTASFLREAGLTVTTVEEITGFGSLFGGRVKTLHPLIHGAILFRRDHAGDARMAADAGIEGIDLVVVNLYPFGAALEQRLDADATLELIDIGGPALVRAAAKNHRHVAVVTSPQDYEPVRRALERGAGTLEEPFAASLAARAFAVTAEYDAAIARWMAGRAGTPTRRSTDTTTAAATGAPNGKRAGEDDTVAAAGALPETWEIRAPRRRTLRYGENPSQQAGLYGVGDGFPFNLEQLHGKELSYNNYLDLACGREVLAEFGDALVAVVVKHGIPCGAARGPTLAETYLLARDADALSAFGGVVALSRPVDAATAALLNETFLEVVLAPDYAPEALAVLRKKKNRVLLRCAAESLRGEGGTVRGRFAGTGFLLQTPLPRGTGEDAWRVVTKREPDARERADLLFGWKILKHVRSNGILFAKDGRTVGVGSGQCSRIDAVEAAIRKAERAGHDLGGAIMVSDAFFPFRDGVDRAAAVGVSAVLQPGGSVRDDETVQACDEHGMAMALNGARVFSHG
jgi:phosphoribosylaminoimidazolecarboxamide formyltransferase/IMP cyclohydrolase